MSGFRAGDVPHPWAGLPDQQGVREIQQIPPQPQGEYLLQPSQCRKESADPDPGREEMATKNETLRIFVVDQNIWILLFEFYFSCKKLTWLSETWVCDADT